MLQHNRNVLTADSGALKWCLYEISRKDPGVFVAFPQTWGGDDFTSIIEVVETPVYHAERLREEARKRLGGIIHEGMIRE